MKVFSCFLIFMLFWTNLGHASEMEDEIIALKKVFKSKNTVLFDLNIESLSATRVPELSDPKLALPQYFAFHFDSVSALMSFSEKCQRSFLAKIKDPALNKAKLWQEFQCGMNKLPSDFFLRAPFMHPSGSSYVFLAEQSNHKEFQSDFAKRFADQKHLIEVANIVLGPGELQKLLQNENTVFAGDYVLFLDVKKEARSNYKAYHRKFWEQFLSKESYRTSTEIQSQSCVIQESNFCWIKNNLRIKIVLTRIYLALSLLVVLIIIFFAIMLIKRRKEKKQDEEKKLFALQMLTHELRTPATSLKLSLESLRTQYDELPEASQKAFLQMCDELGRLDRMVEASKSYLKANDQESKAMPLQTSINSLVEMILSPYEGKILIHKLKKDREAYIERYALEVCLKNLVENALTHGNSPVTVTLLDQNETLEIVVEDQGQMGKSASTGMGLGLSIVKKFLHNLKGELIVRENPTTFIIKLRILK